MGVETTYTCDVCGNPMRVPSRDPYFDPFKPRALTRDTCWESESVQYLHGPSRIKFQAVTHSGKEPEIYCCRACISRLLRESADATDALQEGE